MTHHKHAITSIKALQRTIETDNEVFRWFMHLISQPAVQADTAANEDTQRSYATLKTITFYQKALWILLFFLLLVSYYFHQRVYGYAGIAVLLATVPFHQKIRKLVTQISIGLLSRDFEKESFDQQTLYQIGEFYSKKYGIRSLVTMISSVDAMVRRVLFYAWVFATFVNPLGSRGFWIMLFGSYFIFQAIINTSVIYNRIK